MATATKIEPITEAEFYATCKRRFGDDPMQWAFVCPVCKHRQTIKDYKDARAPKAVIAFSCVGRWRPGSRDAFSGSGPGPCNYAGGGLFAINPRPVIQEDGNTVNYFDFAEDETPTGLFEK